MHSRGLISYFIGILNDLASDMNPQVHSLFKDLLISMSEVPNPMSNVSCYRFRLFSISQ